MIKRLALCALAALCALSGLGAALADTLWLPPDLKTVEASTFEGDGSLDVVVVPDGCETIEALAFAKSGVKTLYLPDSLGYIEKDMLKDVEDVVIRANKGSYAYNWAVDNGYPFSTGQRKIAVITGSMAQSSDEYRATQALVEKYGEDVILTATYPDNFYDNEKGTIQCVAQFANDPDVKAIVVCQAVPGVAEAFRQVKAKRSDVLCLAGESQEDAAEITGSADLAVMCDFVARGYLIVRTAKELGCDTFVHVSFPRHLNIESISRRLAVMKAAGKDLGVTVVEETAVDPVSEAGIEGAMSDIAEKVPKWIKKYGQKSAYFCTNDAHTVALIQPLMENGGYNIEADLPSPLLGYPDVLGVNFSGVDMDDAKAVLKAVEDAVVKHGGAGRFGTWAYPYTYALTAGLTEHAMNVMNGKSALLSVSALSKAMAVYSPGAKWNGSLYIDADTGAKTSNYVLIYQDTYIMGDPGHYMGNASVKVPEKYLKIQ